MPYDVTRPQSGKTHWQMIKLWLSCKKRSPVSPTCPPHWSLCPVWTCIGSVQRPLPLLLPGLCVQCEPVLEVPSVPYLSSSLVSVSSVNLYWKCPASPTCSPHWSLCPVWTCTGSAQCPLPVLTGLCVQCEPELVVSSAPYLSSLVSVSSVNLNWKCPVPPTCPPWSLCPVWTCAGRVQCPLPVLQVSSSPYLSSSLVSVSSVNLYWKCPASPTCSPHWSLCPVWTWTGSVQCPRPVLTGLCVQCEPVLEVSSVPYLSSSLVSVSSVNLYWKCPASPTRPPHRSLCPVWTCTESVQCPLPVLLTGLLCPKWTCTESVQCPLPVLLTGLLCPKWTCTESVQCPLPVLLTGLCVQCEPVLEVSSIPYLFSSLVSVSSVNLYSKCPASPTCPPHWFLCPGWTCTGSRNSHRPPQTLAAHCCWCLLPSSIAAMESKIATEHIGLASHPCFAWAIELIRSGDYA